MRSTSPMPFDVAHTAPYAKVASYGWMPTAIAAVRLPLVAETRLIVLELVSSIQSEPAPNPRPHEPDPIPIFFTTLFVCGLIFSKYGEPYSLTHTNPAAAARGAWRGADPRP